MPVSPIYSSNVPIPPSLPPNEKENTVSIVANASLAPASFAEVPRPEPLKSHDIMEEIAEQINDASLMKLWNRLWSTIKGQNPQLPEPVLETADDLRAWMTNNSKILNSITRLNLSSLCLSKIPPEIKYLPNLEELDLSHNYIQDITPIARFAQLKSLFLNNNHIQDLSPISSLKKLTALVVSHNKIKNADLTSCISLKCVWIEGNDIKREELHLPPTVKLQAVYMNPLTASNHKSKASSEVYKQAVKQFARSIFPHFPTEQQLS